MKLQDCTLGQVQDYLKEGPGGLIIPIGTCEQHGYHLPLGADTLVAERLAEACSAPAVSLPPPDPTASTCPWIGRWRAPLP